MDFFARRASGYSIDEEAASTTIGYFDHVFYGTLMRFSPGLKIVLSDGITGSEEDDGIRRAVSLTCKQDYLEMAEKVGKGVNERERSVLSLHFRDIAKILWDHQQSGIKFTTHGGAILSLEVENSLELEQNLSLRFAGAVREQMLEPQATPGYGYLGMFAGPTKPKPFERKRANLTSLIQGKMPPLAVMRSLALERHRGSERPVPSAISRRRKLALDHIHEGVVAFTVFHASGSGGGLSLMPCNNSRLVLDEESLVFFNDVSEVGTAVSSTTTRRVLISFVDIDSWNIVDNNADVTKNGINITCTDGDFCFAVEDVNHLRVSFEYFMNNFRASTKKLPAEPGTTHGRQVVSIHTLTGEVTAPPPPTGSPDVVDENGSSIRGRTVHKKGGIFGGALQISERHSVKSHWAKVVKHNGWLLKKGGNTKSWMKRYFVLYATSQGHFLSYYAEFWDSPLYNASRKERNMIDLSKITYLRAKSKYKDVPQFAFDIATIEREWTLCADSNEQLQLWL